MIFGTAYNESLADHLRVTVIATGLNSVRKAQATPPLSVVCSSPCSKPCAAARTRSSPPHSCASRRIEFDRQRIPGALRRPFSIHEDKGSGRR